MTINHNTIYPKRYLIVQGDVTTGYTFHGSFATHLDAVEWTLNNLHVGSPYKVAHMFDVQDPHAHRE